MQYSKSLPRDRENRQERLWEIHYSFSQCMISCSCVVTVISLFCLCFSDEDSPVFEVHHPSIDSIPGWALPALGGSLNSGIKLSIVPFVCPGIWCLPPCHQHDIVVLCYLRCHVCSSASVIHFLLASGSYRNTCLGLIPTSQTSRERRCLEHGQSHSEFSSVHDV